MVVNEKKIKVQTEFFVENRATKFVSMTIIIKLFTDQSEVSALPAGCKNNSQYISQQPGKKLVMTIFVLTQNIRNSNFLSKDKD